MRPVIAAVGLFCAVVTAPPAAATSPELVKRLRAALQEIPMVDSHTHLPDPRGSAEALKARKYDVVWLLGGGTYVSEFTSGGTWPEVKANLALNGHHAYYRPILEAFRDLYGLMPTEELTDANVEAVSARMDAAHRKDDVAWTEEVLRKRANVSHLVWLESGNRGQAEMPYPWVHPIWNIDFNFVYVTEPDKKSKKWPLDETAAKFKTPIRNLTDLEKLIQSAIDDFFARGGVSLKSTTAYFRAADFDTEVPRSRADRALATVLKHGKLNGADTKALQDYLMTQVFMALSRNKKPIQFHMGNQQNWNVVANGNPLALNPLLFAGRFWDVKFVILHGAYPYVREAITLTREYNNVYLDLAWMTLFSPAAAKSALAESFDMLAGNQLMFGTDCANLEETYGTVKFTRQILAEVLAEKIESGFLTEPMALQAARRILSTNALELYGLKD